MPKHICPAIYQHKNTPPHIDAYSHCLLLAIQSDLIRFRTGEQDSQRAVELRKINTRLSSALARFEPPKEVRP